MYRICFCIIITFVLVLSTASAEKIQNGKVEKIATIEGVKGFIEGLAYNPADGHLYFVAMDEGWIFRMDTDGNYEKYFYVGTPDGFRGPNGMIWDESRGKFLVAHRQHGILEFDIETKSYKTLAYEYQGKRLNGPNDLCLDSKGNIYFTDPWGSSVDNRVGGVYRIDKQTGELTQLFSHLAFPNGLAVSADDQYIYVGEFSQNRIIRAMLLNDGKATIYAHVMTYFNGGWGPDGFSMDEQGNLYVPCFGTGKIFVVDSTSGKVIDTIEVSDPDGVGPTRTTFGGSDRKTLYFTESWKNEIYRVNVSIPGMHIPPKKK